MSDEINVHLAPINRRLDEHNSRIFTLESVGTLNDYRLSQLEQSSKDMCKQLVETRQEVVTLISDISVKLGAIQAVQAEDRGAKSAGVRSWYFVFAILSALPTILVIMMAFKK